MKSLPPEIIQIVMQYSSFVQAARLAEIFNLDDNISLGIIDKKRNAFWAPGVLAHRTFGVSQHEAEKFLIQFPSVEMFDFMANTVKAFENGRPLNDLPLALHKLLSDEKDYIAPPSFADELNQLTGNGATNFSIYACLLLMTHAYQSTTKIVLPLVIALIDNHNKNKSEFICSFPWGPDLLRLLIVGASLKPIYDAFYTYPWDNNGRQILADKISQLPCNTLADNEYAAFLKKYIAKFDPPSRRRTVQDFSLLLIPALVPIALFLIISFGDILAQAGLIFNNLSQNKSIPRIALTLAMFYYLFSKILELVDFDHLANSEPTACMFDSAEHSVAAITAGLGTLLVDKTMDIEWGSLYFLYRRNMRLPNTEIDIEAQRHHRNM